MPNGRLINVDASTSLIRRHFYVMYPLVVGREQKQQRYMIQLVKAFG